MMVLRDWSLRPICVLDYMKVRRESHISASYLAFLAELYTSLKRG
jgi:hypothetical protein